MSTQRCEGPCNRPIDTDFEKLFEEQTVRADGTSTKIWVCEECAIEDHDYTIKGVC